MRPRSGRPVLLTAGSAQEKREPKSLHLAPRGSGFVRPRPESEYLLFISRVAPPFKSTASESGGGPDVPPERLWETLRATATRSAPREVLQPGVSAGGGEVETMGPPNAQAAVGGGTGRQAPCESPLPGEASGVLLALPPSQPRASPDHRAKLQEAAQGQSPPSA